MPLPSPTASAFPSRADSVQLPSADDGLGSLGGTDLNEPEGRSPWSHPEQVAAARIQFEREIRGWGTSRLSDEMNAAGYAMNQSAVWRIEKGTPRRRIHLEEAIGFATVFGIPLDELYKPGGPETHQRAAELADVVRTRRRAANEATAALDTAERQLTAYLTAHPGLGNTPDGDEA